MKSPWCNLIDWKLFNIITTHWRVLCWQIIRFVKKLMKKCFNGYFLGIPCEHIFWDFFNTYLLSICLFQSRNWLQFCWWAHFMLKCWLLKFTDLKTIYFYVTICFVLQFSFFLWPWFFSKLDYHYVHNVFKTMVTKAMHKVQIFNMKKNCITF
jgi:hypothetical protein